MNEEGRVYVSNVEEESPAASSGLSRGDVLVNVDGTDVSSLSPEEIASIIRGRADSKASLRVSRSGTLVDYVVIRKPFKLKGVTWRRESVGGKTVGVIKIRGFSGNTREEVAGALERLEEEPVDDLVLDLRGNGGGVLQAAVEVAGLFLPPGKIVTFVVNKDGPPEALMTLAGTGPRNLASRLFVWVDENTASAAEVLTAGLRENDRAKVIGKQTFGKGVIQTLEQLGRGGVAVTVARYETPLHHDINKVGIPVDQALVCAASASEDLCLAPAIK